MSTELAAIPASLMRFNQAMVNVYNFDIPEDQSISKVLSEWAAKLEERGEDIEKILSNGRSYNILLKQPHLETVSEVADRVTKNFKPIECIAYMLQSTAAVLATRDHFMSVLAELVLRYLADEQLYVYAASEFYLPDIITQRCIEQFDSNNKQKSMSAIMDEMAALKYDSAKCYIDELKNGAFVLKWYSPEPENLELWTKKFFTGAKGHALSRVSKSLATFILIPESQSETYRQYMPADFNAVTLLQCAEHLLKQHRKEASNA